MKAMLLGLSVLLMLPGCCGWWKCKKKCEPKCETKYEKGNMGKKKMMKDDMK
jgi:hypothetical protein